MAGLIDSTLEMAGTVKDAVGDAYNATMNSIFGEKPEPAGRTLGKGVEKILGFRVRKDAEDMNDPARHRDPWEYAEARKALLVDGGSTILEYPTACQTNQPHMKIRIFEYKRNRREVDLGLTGRDRVDEKYKKIVTPIATVVLPITSSIVSSFDHGLTDLDGIGNALDGAGETLGTNLALLANLKPGGKLEYLSELTGSVALPTAANVLAKVGLSKLANSDGVLGTAAQQAGRAAGLALNPVTEVGYTRPAVRAHAFEFTMIPKNKDETVTIQQIINLMTYSSLPDEAENTAGMILTYPYICEVTFHAPGGKRVKGVLGIPDSFIQNVTFVTNPVGGGRLMTDGTPVSYKLSVSFKELKSMTRKDYSILRRETLS